MPVTAQFLVSGDLYRVAIGLAFVIAAIVILRSLANSHAAFHQIVSSQSEINSLVTALQLSEERYRVAALVANDIIWTFHWTKGGSTSPAPRPQSWAIMRLLPEHRRRGGWNGFILTIVRAY